MKLKKKKKDASEKKNEELGRMEFNQFSSQTEMEGISENRKEINLS